MVTGGPLDAFAALPLPPSPGITVTPTDRLVTTEAGGMDAFTVILNTRAGIVEGLTGLFSSTSRGHFPEAVSIGDK